MGSRSFCVPAVFEDRHDLDDFGGRRVDLDVPTELVDPVREPLRPHSRRARVKAIADRAAATTVSGTSCLIGFTVKR